MKPVTEVRQETAEMLGNAVAEVARRAIRPELDPFRKSLESLVGHLEGHAEELGEQVRAEKKALDAVNKQLGEVVITEKRQAEGASDTRARIHELRERLDALANELGATRDEQATTVAALNSLRDEVTGWMRVSNEQAERLASVVERAEALSDALTVQASAFSELGNALSGKIETHAAEVLMRLGKIRADVAQEAFNVKNLLGVRFGEQETFSRAVANEIVSRVEANVTSVSSGVASALQASSGEMAMLGGLNQSRHEAATAEVRALIDALRSDILTKVESGLLQTVERMETNSQRSFDGVSGLRTSAETRFDSLQARLGTVLDRLSVRHEEHDRELIKTARTAGRVFRLVVANVVLVLIALTIGSLALWVAAR
jgi:predicted  nucleic acid-binding Zn-ribbon protein